MGKQSTSISEEQQAFIEAQQMFFVATAAAEGRVNLSPKGMDTLRVVGPQRVLWLNLTGSGNETAAHLRESARMTLMWCAFEGRPKILRLFGRARALHPRDTDWSRLIDRFPPSPGPRQIIDMTVELVQTSCGFGVPLYAYQGQREQIREWAERKGEVGVREYWDLRNRLSLDGKPTGILEDA